MVNTKLTWFGVLIALVFTAAGGTLAVTSSTLVLTPPALVCVILLVIALLTAGKSTFTKREEIERQNVEEYRHTHPSSELFQESDEALRLAQRANRTFSVFAVPIITVLTGAALSLFAIVLWKSWRQLAQLPSPANPLQAAVFALGLFLGALIAGSYFLGTSRETEKRWLRPLGAWLLFLGFLWLLGGVILLTFHWGIGTPRWNANIAKFSLALTILLSAELVLNVIIDFYRPRTGKEERPVYESRILALFTEPGGMAANIAASLDYQFGFRVSEAGFYRFFERTFVPFALLLIVLFWGMTTVVTIKTEEQGIRLRLGKVVSQEALEPGLYFKLPWPFARIYKFPVERVQKLTLGYDTGDPTREQAAKLEREGIPVGDLSGRVIVWDKQHNVSEENFVVASKRKQEMPDSVDIDTVGNVPVSVYFMTASVPLYYKIKDLYDYEFNHRDSQALIERIGMREITAYLAGKDFFDILTIERRQGGKELQKRIQAAVDRMELGVKVVFVGLEGIHPPVRVGSFFNEVVSASEEKETTVLQAEKYATAEQPQAEAEGYELEKNAEGKRYERIKLAEAEALRFTRQLQAFRKSPKIFLLRNYLDVLEREGSSQQKYLISAEDSKQIITLDLAEKLRPGLLDVDLKEENRP
ncbi:MAG: protease modulator HflK [Verrucomicrobiota bacterium]